LYNNTSTKHQSADQNSYFHNKILHYKNGNISPNINHLAIKPKNSWLTRSISGENLY